MIRNTGKRSLEGYKIFPYVAWTLVGLFAVFVYNLTTEVSIVTDQLQIQNNDLSASDADFENYLKQRQETISTSE